MRENAARGKRRPIAGQRGNERTEGRRKILVVDDNRNVADSMAFMLSHEGYTATARYSASEAIELSRSIKPDIVISDIVMPGTDGIDMGVAIRSFLPCCKILLFSGEVLTQQMRERLDTQAAGIAFVEKPIHPADLLAMLRMM